MFFSDIAEKTTVAAELNQSQKWKNTLFPDLAQKEKDEHGLRNPESVGEARAQKLMQELFAVA